MSVGIEPPHPTSPTDRLRMAWPGTVVDRIVPLVQRAARWQGKWTVATAVLSILALAWVRHHLGVAGAWAVPGALLSTAPLLLARRWPLLGLTIVLSANAVYLLLARLSWPLPSVIAWLLALAVCPLWLPRRRATALLVMTECVVLAAVFIPDSINPTPWDAHIAEALAALMAWGIGENLRARQQSARLRAAADEQVLRLLESDAAARGRADMARELHDVVAHHVSLIAVRAAMAPYQVADLTSSARAVLDEIAGEARTALAELRTVLGVLRSEDGLVPHSPVPTLSDLPGLFERMRAAGLDITVNSGGEPRRMPESIELCVYRVIQEALTNASRHAPGSVVAVTLRYSDDRLSVVVSDNGMERAPSSSAGPGFGLIGMRERVASLGGQFEAAPTGSGFAVRVSVPVPSPTPGRSW